MLLAFLCTFLVTLGLPTLPVWLTEETDATQIIVKKGGRFSTSKIKGLNVVTEIDFSNTNINDGDLALLHLFPSIRSLDLSRTKVTDAGMVNVSQQKHLVHLYISDVELTKVGFARLSKLRRLRWLFAGRFGESQPLRASDLREIAKLTELRKLVICGVMLNKHEGTQLQKLCLLEELIVTDSQLTAKFFEELIACKNLVKCDFSNSRLDDNDMKFIGQLTSLKRLDLSNTKVTDRELRHLKSLAKLQCLLVDECYIRGGGFEYLTRLNQLRDLSAVLTDFEDDHAAVLEKLRNIESLKITNVNLHQKPFSDKTLKSISKMRALQTLVLQSERITDAGVMALAKCPKLTHLKIGGGMLATKKGFWEFRNHKHLKSIVFDFMTSVSVEDLQELRRQLPNVRLELGFNLR